MKTRIRKQMQNITNRPIVLRSKGEYIGDGRGEVGLQHRAS